MVNKLSLKSIRSVIQGSRFGWALLVSGYACLTVLVAVVVSAIAGSLMLVIKAGDVDLEVVLGLLFPLTILILTFLLAIFFGKRWSVKFSELLQLKLPRKNVWWLAPLSLAVYLILLIGSMLILQNISPNLAEQEQEVANTLASLSGVRLITLAITVGIVAPIAEELFFRGLLIRMYARKLSYPIAIFISSFLFALAHTQVNVGVDTFLFGLILGFLFWKTESIYPSIGLHMLKNCLALYAILS